MIRFNCPFCDKRLKVPPEHAGRRVRCARCQKRLSAPKPDRTEPEILQAEILEELEDADVVDAQLVDEGEILDAEILDDDEPSAPAGRAARVEDRIVRQAPAERGKPAVGVKKAARLDQLEELQEAEELDEFDELEPAYEDEDKLPRRSRKRRGQQGRISPGVILGVSLGLMAVWAGMAVAGFFFRPVSLAMLVIGGVVISVGTRWILVLARQEGMGAYYCCLLIPFYETYFTYTRLHRTWMPCVLCWIGRFFCLTAVILLAVHFFHHKIDEVRGRLRQGLTQADAACEQLLAAPNHAEARGWLSEASKQRGFSNLSKDAALKLVNDLYARGAKQVDVADIETDPDRGELGTYLVVTLPDEPDKRTAVLELINERFADEDGPRADKGQKYELLTPE